VTTMRIVHLYKEYSPVLGGIENHVRWLAEHQAARGHDVSVLVCGSRWRGEVLHMNRVRVIRAGRLFTAASMPISVTYPRLVRRLRADIAHLHLPFPLGALSNWLVGRSRATVITYHCDIVRQRMLLKLYGPLLDRVLASCHAIITTSRQYAESSLRLAPVTDRCVVIPLAIDTARFARPEEAREGLLFVGRLRYYKRLDTLLRAMTHLPGVHLSVIGEGPMRPAAERLTRRLDLGSRVSFLGEVPDSELPAYYAAARLLVLPADSRAEAFGTVLLEAMAAGTPVVSTEIGTATSWVNVDGITGRVVPPRDPTALADAIEDLLSNEPLRARMGHAARERVTVEFDFDTMLDRVEHVYESVLAQESRLADAC
jgi:glycosyltransferase involved in cell wall biosynthesis